MTSVGKVLPIVLLRCPGPSVGSYLHIWIGQPTHSARILQRYRCAKCGCWGWRRFSAGAKPIVQAYTTRGSKGSRVLVFEARSEWEDDGSPDVGDRWEEKQERLRAESEAADEHYAPPHRPVRLKKLSGKERRS